MATKKILIAGGTGLVGSRLQQLFPPSEYEIHILTRQKKASQGHIHFHQWDIKNGLIGDEAVKVDAIVNLTGAGIADGRWTASRKKVLIDSRVKSLQLIRKGLERTGHKPAVIVSASAIGYYGDRGNEELNEDSPAGKGFLAECCTQWENAAQELEPFAERLAIMRIGIVLSTRGGALPKILMTKAAHLLNYFGSGKQYYSWIHIDDLCNMIISAIKNEQYKGVYNAVTPHPVTNKEFTQLVGKGLDGKYLIFPAPAFGLRLALGEMADVVLNSNRVLPLALEKTDYEYSHQDLPPAIEHLMKTKI